MKPQNLLRLLGAALAGAFLFALTPALHAQTASAYVTSGMEKYRAGDYDGAIADFTKAIDLNSSYLGAYNDRGLAKSKQGNFDGAIADFNLALKMKPAFSDAFFNRGAAEFLQGNLEAANGDFGKVIELKPDNQAAYFRRGMSRDCQANFEAASADYAKALTLKAASEETADYLLLHSALLGRRMGHGVDVRLKATADWNDDWAKSLAAFVSDQITEAELLKRANMTDDHDDKIQRETVAQYFIGVLKIVAGDKAAGRAALQKAFDASGPAATVHRLARAELDRP